MKRIASLNVSTPIALSNEDSNCLCISSSSETVSAISLSDSEPKARIKITNGISVGTPGSETYIAPSDFSLSSILALKPTVVENIFAWYTGFTPFLSMSTIMRLGARSSIATIARSEPFIMK